ncbi:MAG: riboflavin synthase [Clostridium sp.]
MFTGIVEEKGRVKKILKGRDSLELLIEGKKVLEDTLVGDSIAVNGICLTVKRLEDKYFFVDVMDETIKKSNIGNLKEEDFVNLERALTLNKRLGGHIVSGHIDGVGKIKNIESKDNAKIFTIDTEGNILKYIILKGSITIDGISLTVTYVDKEKFKVSIIPHTMEETILLDRKIGSRVNLEVDLIGKYVEKLMGYREEKKNITEEFLKLNGF